MSGIKITDLVDQAEIQKLKELNAELQGLLATYTNVAKDLARGIDINVRVIGDIDKLEKLLIDKSKEAAATTERLNAVISQQGQIIGNTTNTISRHLMEQERINKAQRQAYTEYDRVKQLLEQYNDSYSEHTRRLVSLKSQLDANKKAQKDLESMFKIGRMTLSQYTDSQAVLVEQHRLLTQEKRTLAQTMTKEEKAMQAGEGSYIQLSQQLEMMKDALKGMDAEVQKSDLGKEFESAIQNLDAHLKDMAADMGEFQRNVGNYAISGKNGVVTSESLNAVLSRQAITTKDLSDQNKILTEARAMLNRSDADYSHTVELINEKLAENSRRMSDVSDIMEVQAKTAADAESQNKRLQEALKLIDQSSEDAQSKISALNKKIDENNKVIQNAEGNRASAKKSLKELVLEIANLSVEYAKLSQEEQNSADGQALRQHIQELTEDAGVLRDAIKDTNEAITNAASDTRGFDQLSGSIQLAIDGFGLAAGAAEMLGISEGELAGIQTKLQAAIAASNAMSKIQASLQKQSALMQAAATIQTKLRTTAENIHTAAQGKGVIATKAATVAQWAFNAAASANPIGLVIVGVVALAAGIWGLCKAYKAFVGDSEAVAKSYETQKAAAETMKEIHSDEIRILEAAGVLQSTISKNKVKNLQEEYEAAKRNYDFAVSNHMDEEKIAEAKNAMIESEKALYDEYSSTYFRSRKLIKDEYLEDLRLSKGNAAVKKRLLDEEIDGQKILIEQLRETAVAMGWNTQSYDDMLEALEKRRTRLTKEINKEAAENAKQLADDLKKVVRASEDAMIKLIKDSTERELETEKKAHERKIEDLKEEIETARRTKKNYLKYQAEYNKQIEAAEEEHRRKMTEIEMNGRDRQLQQQIDLNALHLAGVKKGTQEEFDYRIKSIELQQQKELNTLERGIVDGTIKTEKGEAMRLAIVQKYAKLKLDAEDDFADERVQKIQKSYTDAQSKRDNDMISDLNSLKMKYAEQLALVGNNERKKTELTEIFERKSAQITEKYAIQSAQATVDMLNDCLKQEGLSAEDREEIEIRLAAARMGLETAVVDHMIAEQKRLLDNDKKTTEGLKLNAQYWLRFTADALNEINDLSAAIYDSKIAKVEKEQEINEEAGEKEQNRIEDLVNKKVITEEEGEARKRAAEAQTAKKNEELEKKKQQLKYKQALWDKSNSIAQTGISTALAIMNALETKPFFPVGLAMAATAGTMGAIQLATILATPIPKYAKGTDNHKGGPAIVGDGGRPEVIMYNGGAWLTPDTPTLVDIPSGAVVIPTVKDFEQSMATTVFPVIAEMSPAPQPYDDSAVRREIATLAKLIKAQTKQQHADNYLNSYEIFKSKI